MYWEKCNIGYFCSGSKELVKISGLEVQNKKPFGFTFRKRHLIIYKMEFH